MSEEPYEYADTRALVELVNDASALVAARGEGAFDAFRVSPGRWRDGERYIFVLDPDGNMLVHPDPELEGRNALGLKDISGRPVVRGLLDAALAFPGKQDGWYHYQWPVPGGLLPRWKSSHVRLATAPSGRRYVVGSGTYNDRMERAFVIDMVKAAVAEIEKHGAAAFPLFHDPAGPFMAKDAYVFVYDGNGIDLVNPAFPNLEGRDLSEVKDSEGKPVMRLMLDVLQTSGAGWVDYMWPKPGESVATRKSAYVGKARMGEEWVLVGSGVYLAGAPTASAAPGRMSTAELVALVREAASLLEARGAEAYPELREQGSKWFHDGTYIFVWTLDGERVFHAAEPAGEGRNMRDMKDIVGRPVGRMILAAAGSPAGEAWVHYMYPEPDSLFPAWKSTFVKQVTFPSGTPHLVGCGIYNMQMDRAFIEDLVNRAAALLAERGAEAFPRLRDKTGPFVFMDTYVFVMSTDGTELVNPTFPALEGRNLLEVRDLKGNPAIRDEIAAAMEQGSAWLDVYWYKSGQNTPARKPTFVRRVESGPDTYVVGAGIYTDE